MCIIKNYLQVTKEKILLNVIQEDFFVLEEEIIFHVSSPPVLPQTGPSLSVLTKGRAVMLMVSITSVEHREEALKF